MKRSRSSDNSRPGCTDSSAPRSNGSSPTTGENTCRSERTSNSRELSLIPRRRTAKGRMGWRNVRIALSGSGSTRSCPLRNFSLVDRTLGYGGLSGVASASINFTEEDPVRNHLREAALAVTSATDWLPCMGVDPEEHRANLGPRSSKCLLLGYCEPNQYKLYKIHSRKTAFSRDVEFGERAPVRHFMTYMFQ
jgi:hypothetical protein